MSHLSPADLLRERYGAAAAAMSSPAWNETLATLLSHRSVRHYLPDRLPDGTLEALVAAAQSASSSSNLQVWSVVAVEDAARKQRLAHLGGNQQHIHACPLFLVWLVDLARLAAVAEQRGLHSAGLDYLELFIVGIVDAALAAQNAVVAAESLGLGSVYIGGMRNHPEQVAAELGLPPRVMALFGLCLGYPDPARPAAIKPRLPQQAVLHRETYQHAQHIDAVESYNDTMAAFYDAQHMAVRGDWATHCAERVAGPDTLTGRDRMRAALAQLGFELR